VWLSRDPIGEEGGINLYGYVGNGPVGYTDSLGLDYSTQDEAGNAGGTLASELMQAGGGNMKGVPADMQTKTEFAGRVYQKPDGRWDITPPHNGSVLVEPDGKGGVLRTPNCNPYRNADGSPVTIPQGAKDGGTYHSHGQDNTASDTDKGFLNGLRTNPNKQPMYIGSPSGVNKVTPTPTAPTPTAPTPNPK